MCAANITLRISFPLTTIALHPLTLDSVEPLEPETPSVYWARRYSLRSRLGLVQRVAGPYVTDHAYRPLAVAGTPGVAAADRFRNSLEPAL